MAHNTADANTTHRGCTPLNRSQAARDTARALSGGKWTRTPHTQQDTLSVHTGGQEPTGPGRRTRITTHPACKPVNRTQVAQDTAHTTQHTKGAHR